MWVKLSVHLSVYPSVYPYTHAFIPDNPALQGPSGYLCQAPGQCGCCHTGSRCIAEKYSVLLYSGRMVVTAGSRRGRVRWEGG